MPEIINMPRLSDTMEEGTVAKWFKKVGDRVKEGDILAEIETDKATMEFEAFYEGELLHIGVNEGDTAPVDTLLAIIGDKNENISKYIGESSEELISEESSKKVDINAIDKVKPIGTINKNIEVINMPRLSDTMEEGVVASWNKKIGDLVQEGDILAEIETDKATMEFESFYTGHLIYIGVKEGESALVDSVLAIIGDKDADVDQILLSLNSSSDDQKIHDSNNIIKKERLPTENSKELDLPINTFVSEVVSSDRIIASPLAKKIAKNKGIDISQIIGTGDNGRVIKRDVENFKPNSSVSIENMTSNGEESFTEFANSQMRKTIAKRLSQSKFSAPHYYLGVEFDMENLISFRIQHNNSTGSKISFNDLIVKASAKALKLHPEVNSRWYDDKIVHFNHVHIGVAVAVDEGLVVPVVKFADEKSLLQIGNLVKDMATRARSKKLTPSEMDGSTFTISNLGMFGISEFTSIINQPNSAILSVGAIIQKPVVKEGEIVVGNTMKLTLACDHRSVDGATGSAFLKTLRNLIENPIGILL
jgi:pyruvate dehydrogenase E2 component (dihydrolipoamide acetyltransferase)